MHLRDIFILTSSNELEPLLLQFTASNVVIPHEKDIMRNCHSKTVWDIYIHG